MKVLTYTTLFPNNIQPTHGIFIKERMMRVTRHCELKVVAPVPYFPYFPPLKIFRKWYAFSQVRPHEFYNGVETFHPRYFITPKIGRALYGHFLFQSTINSIKAIQNEYDFDLIDAHFVYPDGFAGVLAAQALNKPVIVSARGSDINLYSDFPLIRKRIIYALQNATQIIAVSQALKEKIVDLGLPESKVAVLPNGVDKRKFFPMSKIEAREKLNLPLDKAIILSVGTLMAKKKGFHHIIDAMRRIKDRLNEDDLPLFVIIGQGEDRKTLENQINQLELASSVRLAGPKPHDELYLWYNACDIFCLASPREGWPNVLLEALACGKPVVATKVGGIPEIINSKEYGILVERQNAEAIAEAILQALQTDWNHDRISNYGCQNTWENVADKVFSIFKTAL